MKASMGKRSGNFLTETVSYVKKEVNAVQKSVEKREKQVALTSAIFGGAIGIVIGIVGVSLWDRYMTPQAAPQQRISTPV
jgi:uncharacterized membrane protein